jgi:hypothetical protein
LDNPDTFSSEQISWAIEKCQCTVKVKTMLYSLLREYKQTKKLTLWQPEQFSKQAFLVKDILGLDNAVDNARQMSMDFISFNFYLNSLVAQKVENASDDLIISINHCLMKAYSETEKDGTEYYQAWYNAIVERGHLM